MNPRSYNWTKPPLWQAIAVSVASFLVFLYIRVYFYSDAVVPLSYALPLLLILWHRDRKVHYVLAISFTLMAATKVFLIAPADNEMTRMEAYAMMLINIWSVGLVTDWLVRTQGKLENLNENLTESNAELEASNEELAAREEEISSQNEELQRQTEEMEQQMEELQRQSEELQQQSEELQELQLLAESREQVLQSLFDISTGLGSEGGSEAPFHQICEATANAFGDTSLGALLLERVGEDLLIRGRCGFDEDQSLVPDTTFTDPFARMVVDQARTACVEDLERTPDIEIPQTEKTPPRSVIAAPLLSNHVAIGVIMVYSAEPRQWSEVEFQTADWLAAQGSLLLAAMQLRQELDDRSREAEEASHRKTQFLAAVSHDVRTPANAINLMAEVMEQARHRPELAANVPQMLTRLRENTRQLVELVSDVLDLSRLDCGKIDLDLNDFDFRKLVQSELQHYQPVADVAGIALRSELPDQPIWISTDRMKLIRVVENLLGNAIKFTDKGTVTVRVFQTEEDIQLQVRDTGVGIPSDHLDHIFDEFFQVKNPERDRGKGTGLGLAICRRLIDALGFSLTVRSQAGEGSTFTIHMPSDVLTNPPPENLPVDRAPIERRNLAGIRILLVEDHETTRMAVSQLLTVQGARIDQASDARQAIQSLRQCDADVLLLDLMLPDMDGREVLRKVQANRPPRLRCILAVSGDVTDQRQQEVLALGADGLVSKPIETNNLADRILKILAEKPLKDPKNGTVAPPLTEPSNQSVEDE